MPGSPHLNTSRDIVALSRSKSARYEFSDCKSTDYCPRSGKFPAAWSRLTERSPELPGFPADPDMRRQRCALLLGCPGIAFWVPAERLSCAGMPPLNSASGLNRKASAFVDGASIWRVTNSSSQLQNGVTIGSRRLWPVLTCARTAECQNHRALPPASRQAAGLRSAPTKRRFRRSIHCCESLPPL
jgi:hypothetical protein